MSTSLEPITIRGRYLYRGNERFFVRGVVYQVPDEPPRWTSGPSVDPIADRRLSKLEYDISLMRQLGINTIYVCTCCSHEHAQAMELLDKAGIYVLANPWGSGIYINRLNPRTSYNAEYMKALFKTVDVLAQYPNVLGLHVASRLINNDKTKNCAPIISAVVRDLKRYVRLRNRTVGQRILPVGYGGNSWGELDRDVLHYLSTANEEDRIDFWTCCWYSHGDDPNDIINKFQDANLPMFFSEYTGLSWPRQFDETTSLFSPHMTNIFSGGCAYELLEGGNKYGLLDKRFDDNNPDDGNRDRAHSSKQESWGTLVVFKDFENYKARLAATENVRPSMKQDVDETATKGGEFQTQMQKELGRQMGWTDEDDIPSTCVDWEQIE